MKGKISRKQLLKGGLAGAASVAAMPFAGSVAFASKKNEENGVAVHINGTVRLTAAGGGLPQGFPIEINVDAAGRASALSGSGWDTEDADASNQDGACYFAQRGRLQGDVISLHGAVFFSQTVGFRGAHVTTVASLETGHITWTFAGLVFTGNGVVTKVD